MLLALIAILALYGGVGLLAAIGTVTISRLRFPPRFEHIFFSLLLIPVAVMYLAFVAYFDKPAAFQLELYAVLCFTALGLAGLRLPGLLILGWSLHGAWDLVHEIAGHTSLSSGPLQSFTAIPLAYGVFCACYDFSMAAYFFTRLPAWRESMPGRNLPGSAT